MIDPHPNLHHRLSSTATSASSEPASRGSMPSSSPADIYLAIRRSSWCHAAWWVSRDSCSRTAANATACAAPWTTCANDSMFVAVR